MEDSQTKSAEAKEKAALAASENNAAPAITPIAYKIPKGFYVYMCYTAFTMAVAAAAVLSSGEDAAARLQRPFAVSAFVGFGPIVFAAVLMRASGDRSDMRWPFHKDGPQLPFHLVVGFLIAVLPVYHTMTTLLAPSPEGRAYCQLWGIEKGPGTCEGVAS